MIYRLDDNDMETLFQRISEEYETFGTVRENGDIVFGPVSHFSDVVFGKSTNSPKEFIIQRNENLIELPKAEKKAVFGVMSCDLKGFYIMDLQILGKDPFYTERRKNTLFINFICTEMCRGGFCTTFGGPMLDRYQIQILKEENAYHVIAAPEYDRFMEGFKREKDESFQSYNSDFEKRYGKLPVEGIENRMKWTSTLWNKFANYCISCGACNYSCPTCYCFDIYEEGSERKREWDSCILEGFTSTAAGNIRPDLSDRLRQRFYHKYKYYKLSRGTYLCTGCNRCVDDCPVDIDIKEVITHDYSKE
ncbi:MAG: 4Fe-4S dicluster domain-containing protein [Thermoplasmata archaeon]